VHVFSSLLCRISKWNASQTRTNVGRGLILSVGNWLDGCGLLLVDLMWVTGCPALIIREEKREVKFFQQFHNRLRHLWAYPLFLSQEGGSKRGGDGRSDHGLLPVSRSRSRSVSVVSLPRARLKSRHAQMRLNERYSCSHTSKKDLISSERAHDECTVQIPLDEADAGGL